MQVNTETLKERSTKVVKNSEAELAKRDNSIADLKNQKENLNQELKALQTSFQTKAQELEQTQQESQELNRTIDQMQVNTETLKERSTKVVKNSEAELAKRDNSIADLKNQKENLNQELKALQTSFQTKAQELEQTQQESQELNRTIDEIVNDLASIKESKCWLYTKPLRDIQQVFRGEKNE